MHKLVWLSGLIAAVSIGCGGQTDAQGSGGSSGTGATGGSGATGGTGATGTGATGGSGASGGSSGSGGMPPECSVPSNGPGPYAVTIRFINPTAEPLFVRQDCALNWSLYSCADGYTSEIDHVADCMGSCSDPSGGCIACGACMMMGHEVTNSQPYEVDWSGNTFTFGQNSNGCQCYDAHAAPAGKYSILIPVFYSDQDAQNDQKAFDAYGWLDLPAPGGIVEVVLSPPGL